MLVQRTADGCEDALRELINRHRERLYRLAYGILLDRAAADDAVQETFIRLWQRARRYDSRYAVSTWLCTICARRCYDELRRRRRHREAVVTFVTSQEEGSSNGGDMMSTDGLLAILQRVVATLPAKQRVVYQLREIECLDTDTTAKVARMTTSQVKANLWAARTTVREKLKQYGI